MKKLFIGLLVLFLIVFSGCNLFYVQEDLIDNNSHSGFSDDLNNSMIKVNNSVIFIMEKDLDMIKNNLDLLFEKNFTLQYCHTTVTTGPCRNLTITKKDDLLTEVEIRTFYDKFTLVNFTTINTTLSKNQFIKQFSIISYLESALKKNQSLFKFEKKLGNGQNNSCYTDFSLIDDDIYVCFNELGVLSARSMGGGHYKKGFYLESYNILT